MFAAFLQWLRSLFWSKQLEVALIGLQNSGKVRAELAPLAVAAGAHHVPPPADLARERARQPGRVQ